MIRSLYGRLSVLALLLFYLAGGAFIALTLFSNRMYFHEMNQRISQSLAKRLVSQKELMPEGSFDAGVFYEIAEDLRSVSPSVDLYFLDRYGHIVASSLPAESLVVDHVSMEPIFQFLEEKKGYPIFGDNPRVAGGREIFSACPVPVSGEAESYLYAVLGEVEGGSLGAMLGGSSVVRLSLYTFVAGLIFFTILALLLFHRLTRRVRRLSVAMENFSVGGPAGAASPAGGGAAVEGDEIDRLGRVFEEMADRISRQMEEVRRAENLRKELVTNVSHDLRTPLTSLQGYLETLKIKENLSPEQRRLYLETSIHQSDRLRRLISELFELSRLEAGEVRMEPETIVPGELVQDVVQKFHLAAEKKGIDLAWESERDLPPLRADIGLLERALENLIKNSLQYTSSGGRVRVSLSRRADGVVFTVEDTGCGIPAEELPRVFDRYFRARSLPPESDEGTGLGLAITKRIVQMHGGSIAAESVTDVGSTFTMYIPHSAPARP